MLVKICGTTSVSDAMLAHNAGADFLGVILFHPPSPRNIDLETARAISDAARDAAWSTPGRACRIIAVTVNLSLSQLLQLNDSLSPRALQLHGDEPPEIVEELAKRGVKVWAAVGGEDARERGKTLLDAGAEAILVDARGTAKSGATIYGGTGKRSDWNLAREFSDAGSQIVLSGGLAPGNVEAAIAATRPWLVDCVSGVEAEPGKKDAAKVRAFIANAIKQLEAN